MTQATFSPNDAIKTLNAQPNEQEEKKKTQLGNKDFLIKQLSGQSWKQKWQQDV